MDSNMSYMNNTNSVAGAPVHAITGGYLMRDGNLAHVQGQGALARDTMWYMLPQADGSVRYECNNPTFPDPYFEDILYDWIPSPTDPSHQVLKISSKSAPHIEYIGLGARGKAEYAQVRSDSGEVNSLDLYVMALPREFVDAELASLAKGYGSMIIDENWLQCYGGPGVTDEIKDVVYIINLPSAVSMKAEISSLPVQYAPGAPSVMRPYVYCCCGQNEYWIQLPVFPELGKCISKCKSGVLYEGQKRTRSPQGHLLKSTPVAIKFCSRLSEESARLRNSVAALQYFRQEVDQKISTETNEKKKKRLVEGSGRIPRLEGSFFDHSRLFAVMPYYQGSSIDGFMEGPKRVVDGFAYTKQLLDSLSIMHTIGMIKMRLSLDNIRVTDKGKIIIFGFGDAALVPYNHCSLNLYLCVLSRNYFKANCFLMPLEGFRNPPERMNPYLWESWLVTAAAAMLMTGCAPFPHFDRYTQLKEQEKHTIVSFYENIRKGNFIHALKSYRLKRKGFVEEDASRYHAMFHAVSLGLTHVNNRQSLIDIMKYVHDYI